MINEHRGRGFSAPKYFFDKSWEFMRYDYNYDQLQRIMGMQSLSLAHTAIPTDAPGSTDWGSAGNGLYNEDYTYDGNGNIKTLKRNARLNGVSVMMDNLTYFYGPGTEKQNRLVRVRDQAIATNFPSDFETMSGLQPFIYDNDGRIIEDKKELMTIAWFPFDKPRQVVKTPVDGIVTTYNYGYDALHNRVEKVYVNTSERTAYIRDANGNIMAQYEYKNNKWYWSEQHLYGAERLGVIDLPDDMVSDDEPDGEDEFNAETGYVEIKVRPNTSLSAHYQAWVGKRRYELTNHLGNVMVVVNDLPLIDPSQNFQLADMVSSTDYYPFGMEMPGRVFASSLYAFGFNGKIEDTEILPDGRWQDYGFRAYRPDIGRFVSVDPLRGSYPWNSTYAFAEGDVIRCVDLDGLEKFRILDPAVPYHYELYYVKTSAAVENKLIVVLVSYVSSSGGLEVEDERTNATYNYFPNISAQTVLGGSFYNGQSAYIKGDRRFLGNEPSIASEHSDNIGNETGPSSLYPTGIVSIYLFPPSQEIDLGYPRSKTVKIKGDFGDKPSMFSTPLNTPVSVTPFVEVVIKANDGRVRLNNMRVRLEDGSLAPIVPGDESEIRFLVP